MAHCLELTTVTQLRAPQTCKQSAPRYSCELAERTMVVVGLLGLAILFLSAMTMSSSCCAGFSVKVQAHLTSERHAERPRREVSVMVWAHSSRLIMMVMLIDVLFLHTDLSQSSKDMLLML